MSADDEANSKSRDPWLDAIRAAGGDKAWRSLWYAMKWDVEAETEHAVSGASVITVEEQL